MGIYNVFFNDWSFDSGQEPKYSLWFGPIKMLMLGFLNKSYTKILVTQGLNKSKGKVMLMYVRLDQIYI